jgi:hypothetical protein
LLAMTFVGAVTKRRWPRKGAICKNRYWREVAPFGSDAVTWNVTVSDRHLGVSQQQPIDRGEEAAKQAVGGRMKRRGSSPGHQIPFSFLGALGTPNSRMDLMYTRCQNNAVVCMAASPSPQCSIRSSRYSKKAARRRPWHHLWVRAGPILPLPCEAGRGRRSRGFRRPGDRKNRAPGAGSRRCARREAASAPPRSGCPTA